MDGECLRVWHQRQGGDGANRSPACPPHPTRRTIRHQDAKRAPLGALFGVSILQEPFAGQRSPLHACRPGLFPLPLAHRINRKGAPLNR